MSLLATEKIDTAVCDTAVCDTDIHKQLRLPYMFAAQMQMLHSTAQNQQEAEAQVICWSAHLRQNPVLSSEIAQACCSRKGVRPDS